MKTIPMFISLWNLMIFFFKIAIPHCKEVTYIYSRQCSGYLSVLLIELIIYGIFNISKPGQLYHTSISIHHYLCAEKHIYEFLS